MTRRNERPGLANEEKSRLCAAALGWVLMQPNDKRLLRCYRAGAFPNAAWFSEDGTLEDGGPDWKFECWDDAFDFNPIDLPADNAAVFWLLVRVGRLEIRSGVLRYWRLRPKRRGSITFPCATPEQLRLAIVDCAVIALVVRRQPDTVTGKRSPSVAREAPKRLRPARPRRAA